MPRNVTKRLPPNAPTLAFFFPCLPSAVSASASLPQINAEPPPDSVLYLVCFHLPVSLKKDWKGTWQAEWNESLIAKTEHRYQITRLYLSRVCTLRYPGNKPGNAYPGRYPGTRRLMCQNMYPSMYPGTPRVCTRVPPEHVPQFARSMYPGTPRACTWVPLEYVPDSPQSMYPVAPRVCPRVSPEYVPWYPQGIYPGTPKVYTRAPPSTYPGTPRVCTLPNAPLYFTVNVVLLCSLRAISLSLLQLFVGVPFLFPLEPLWRAGGLLYYHFVPKYCCRLYPTLMYKRLLCSGTERCGGTF